MAAPQFANHVTHHGVDLCWRRLRVAATSGAGSWSCRPARVRANMADRDLMGPAPSRTSYRERLPRIQTHLSEQAARCQSIQSLLLEFLPLDPPFRPRKTMAAKSKKSAKRKYTDILYEVKDQVAWITINREKVLNAFREQTLDEMIDALKSTREDPTIVCAVVTGKGNKSFSAGGDFYAMKRLNFTNAYMWNDRMLGLAMTIRGLPIPVIAMVNGWCMGGGHELALWCDLVIASENAVLGQTGAKVGACPTVGATQYIPRIIGERLAREMIFCARRFGAKEAVEIGLINKCVPQKDLLKETLKWCETMKGHSALTIRMTKKSLNFESDNLYSSWQHGMELLAHVWGSPEANEGMDAFLAGRKPNFQKFRVQAKKELDKYVDGFERDLNAPPSMRRKKK
jgi:dihydroxynaphthoic acid synthetase